MRRGLVAIGLSVTAGLALVGCSAQAGAGSAFVIDPAQDANAIALGAETAASSKRCVEPVPDQSCRAWLLGVTDKGVSELWLARSEDGRNFTSVDKLGVPDVQSIVAGNVFLRGAVADPALCTQQFAGAQKKLGGPLVKAWTVENGNKIVAVDNDDKMFMDTCPR